MYTQTRSAFVPNRRAKGGTPFETPNGSTNLSGLRPEPCQRLPLPD